MGTLFALVFPFDIPPVAMCAVVALSQMIDCFLNHLDTDRIIGSKSWLLTLDDLVCTRDEPILLPLIAGACLPLLTTNVAELCTTMTTRKLSARK